MRVIKRKLFFAWQFEEEEAWLNEMSKKGLHLVAVSPLQIKYEFEKLENKEYTYRIEFLEDLPSSRKGQDYLNFLDELEIEQVGSYIRWVYLRKDKAKGIFELHSDVKSKIEHYKRIRMLFLVFTPLMVANVINMINLYSRAKSSFSLLPTGLTIIVTTLLANGIWIMNNKIKELNSKSGIWE